MSSALLVSGSPFVSQARDHAFLIPGIKERSSRIHEKAVQASTSYKKAEASLIDAMMEVHEGSVFLDYAQDYRVLG
jgi:hypothetical protein